MSIVPVATPAGRDLALIPWTRALEGCMQGTLHFPSDSSNPILCAILQFAMHPDGSRPLLGQPSGPQRPAMPVSTVLFKWKMLGMLAPLNLRPQLIS